MSDKKPSDTITSDIDQVAVHFGKSKRTIFRWVKQGMPALPDGRYDIQQIEAWRKKRDGIAPTMEESEAADGKDFWDKEAKKHQARLRELDYQKRKGELIERRAVEDMFVERIQAIKQGLLTLERSLPPELIGKSEREMAAIIRKSVRSLLDAYSRPLPPSFGA